MSLSRRATLGAALALATGSTAAPAVAAGKPATRKPPAPRTVAPITVMMAQDAAPPASDIDAWIAYEARLRQRMADGGGGRFDDDGARSVLPVINAARAAAGATALAWHDELADAARAHAGDLAARGQIEHLSAEGFDPSHRLWLLGRTTIGSPTENLAYHRQAGPPATPASLVAQWRRSPEGHWQNLLNPRHTHAAFALLRGTNQALLVGLFCRPVATLPQPLPFQARGPDIAEALRSVPETLDPRLGPPQGARKGTREGRLVMQLSLLRRDDPGGPAYVGGPVFLPTR